MTPLAQTFILDVPAPSVEAMFLTSVNLYFAAKSNTNGIEVQIREVDNGYPTTRVLPFGTKILQPSSINISSNASVLTKFTFDTPVLLKTNTQYAIVVSAIANDENYQIWLAENNKTDVNSKSSINLNAISKNGNLFKSSNDLNFTPDQQKSLKYDLYVAQFNSTTANAVYRNSNTDIFQVSGVSGKFIPNEPVVMSNNKYDLALLTVSSMVTPFTVGEYIFQPNTAAITNSTAYGKVYFANSTTIGLSNIGGTFSTTGGGLKGNTSLLTSSNPSAVSQNNIVTSGSNVVNIPFAANATHSLYTDIAVDNFIYVANSKFGSTQVLKITAVNPANNTVRVSDNMLFDDSSAVIGRVRGDAKLIGVASSGDPLNGSSGIFVLDNINANTTSHFANSGGNLLIGLISGSITRVITILDLYYDAITSQFTYIEPNYTSISSSFKGTSNTKILDSDYIELINDYPQEFIDNQRMLLSRSNELSNPGSIGTANSSLEITLNLATSNNYTSPYLDTIKTSSVLTRNLIRKFSDSHGFNIDITNANGAFSQGDTIWQANSTVNTYATVLLSSKDTIVVSNVQTSNTDNLALFNANGTSTITSSTTGVTANVVAVTPYNEYIGNGLDTLSRYVSKNITLADQQDAEDLVTFITAYRPPGSNIRIFAKFLSASDTENFSSKHWSHLIETSSPALISSVVNKDDMLELTYAIPTSVQVYGNNITVSSNTTASVNTSLLQTTDNFYTGDFVYISDNNSSAFNVRRIVSIPNTSTMKLSSDVSFTTSNATIGRIPNLRTQYGAFKYDGNYNIIRYTTSTDGVFDSYKTFAIKALLTSNDSIMVPRLADIRSIALQV
jgi:hypothetical protein